MAQVELAGGVPGAAVADEPQERVDVDALALGRRLAREVHVLPGDAEARAPARIRRERVDAQLRQPLVRLEVRVRRAGQRVDQGGLRHDLEVGHARHQRIAGGRGVGQLRAALEVGDRGGRELAGEILEVTRVAGFGVAGLRREPPVDQAAVVEIEVRAPLAGALVVAEHLVAHARGFARRQVAPLGGDQGAALGHVARRDLGVVVRREVQVQRHAHVEAGGVGVAERGEQDAGAAAVVDRELEPRQVQDRHVAEAQARVLGAAEALLAVELDVAGLEEPRLRAGRAGRVVHVRHVHRAVLGEAHGLGRAARGAADQRELGAVKRAGLGGEVELGAAAAHDEVAVAEQRFGGQPDLLRLRIVGQRLRLEPAAALDQPHRAGQRRQAALRELGLVGGQHEPVILGRGQVERCVAADLRAEQLRGRRGGRRQQQGEPQRAQRAEGHPESIKEIVCFAPR